MSAEKRPIGFIPPETAEKCKNLNCPLLTKMPTFDQCQVKANIQLARHSKNARQDAINMFRQNIPEGCPLGYKS